MKKDPVCNMDIAEETACISEFDGESFYFCSEGCREKFLEEKYCKYPRTTYDLIIIGGGPAGLTAAVYASTLKVEAFLIARDLGGQAIDSSKIENYMGFDFITGPELIRKFQYQMIHSHYIDHVLSDVEKVEKHSYGFKITTSELREYFARALIVTCGMARRRLAVPGEEEFQRKGVFYGNIHDYSFVAGEDVAVIGGGNSSLQIAEDLHTVARNIYVVSDLEFTADASIVERISGFSNVRKYEGYKVVKFEGDGSLSGIVIRKAAGRKSHSFPVRGVFIAIGLKPNSGLVSQLVETNEKGEIMIGPDCSTVCPGIFAAGDVTNAFGKRIIIASGEGAKAALAARQYLLSLESPNKRQ